MVVTDSLGVIKFGRKVIARNKSLVEDVLKFQGTRTGKQALRKVLEQYVRKLKELFAVFEACTAKLPASGTSLTAPLAELASLQEDVSCVGSGNA